jgi:hypothetical protein
MPREYRVCPERCDPQVLLLCRTIVDVLDERRAICGISERKLSTETQLHRGSLRRLFARTRTLQMLDMLLLCQVLEASPEQVIKMARKRLEKH